MRRFLRSFGRAVAIFARLCADHCSLCGRRHAPTRSMLRCSVKNPVTEFLAGIFERTAFLRRRELLCFFGTEKKKKKMKGHARTTQWG